MILQLPAASAGSFEAYCRYAYSFPILSREEEKVLAEKAKNAGDVCSVKKLILHNIRFVITISRSYQGYKMPLSDLTQEGVVGLMKAIKRFDPSLGMRLVTFAVHWVKSEIHEFIIKNLRTVKVATTKAQRKLFFNLNKLRNSENHLSLPEAEDIASQLGVPVREVFVMDQRLSYPDLWYDATVSKHDDDSLVMSEIYADDNSIVDVPLADNQELERKQVALSFVLDKLCDRDRDIIVNRWLGETKATLSSLGEKYDVSPERIRQLEKAAIKKMKKYFPLI